MYRLQANTKQGWVPGQCYGRKHYKARATALSPMMVPLLSLLEAAFQIKPLFEAARKKATEKIRSRGEQIGLKWDETVALRLEEDWDGLVAGAKNPAVVHPDYYLKPFHGYVQGNMNLQAALEVDLAAQAVHATLMDPAGVEASPTGDDDMRQTFNRELRAAFAARGLPEPSHVVDLGCATGLSCTAVMSAFPGVQHVTGVDLSEYFVAVARYLQAERERAAGAKEPLSFIHAKAEATGLPDASVDLVTMCLICHELPTDATNAIFEEAYRILRPGGVLGVFEMNPEAPDWQKIFTNPFALAAFRSTEPWLEQYVELDMNGAMQKQGYVDVAMSIATPKHKVVIGQKPSS